MCYWVYHLGHESTNEDIIEGRTIHHFNIGISENVVNIFKLSHHKDEVLELDFSTTGQGVNSNQSSS